MPKRSSNVPNVDVVIGARNALASRLDENIPRVQCNSVVTGTIKTLVTKMTAGPGPTTLPMSEAITIHHRFLKTARLSEISVLAMATSLELISKLKAERPRRAWLREDARTSYPVH
jgi:hypothetical protein